MEENCNNNVDRLTASVEIFSAPHRGHLRPPVSSCCLTIESFTHCLQQGKDTASLRKVLLIGHFRYSGTSFMSMFKAVEHSLSDTSNTLHSNLCGREKRK